MSSHPKLSILIVNWKSVDFLEKCLASIYSTCGSISFEVIVYDNASFDGSEAMIRSRFSGVQFIQGMENVGFAQSNNLAFQVARGEYLLFLNPDTELTELSLDTLCACLDLFPKAGIVGPRLLNSDLSLQDSCVQSFPTIANQILDTHVLRRIFPNADLWGNRAVQQTGNVPIKTDAVSGACLLARRTAFEAAGCFTTAYFMYCEDVDLCYKVALAGWDVLHLGSAVVVHHGGQSSSKEIKSNFAAIMTRESLYRFMLMRRSPTYARVFRFCVAIIALARIVLLAAASVVTLGMARPSLKPAFVKWWGILRWALGLEAWADQNRNSVTVPHKARENTRLYAKFEN